MSAYEAAGQLDEWHTPAYIFDALGLSFEMDVAAPLGGPRYVPCRRWINETSDGLKTPWQGLVWMNPPFGHQRHKAQWLNRFIDHGNGVALLPDRTSAPWWQDAAPQMSAICFLRGKVKFERPNGTVGESPGNGTTLFAMGDRATQALVNCGLGFVTKGAAR